MQLTFSCPGCGKDYDLPWSMAGKKARCKRCSHEFVIPAPYEPTAPRSSEAIPVARTPEAPRTSPVARTVRIEVPPPEPPEPPEPTTYDVEDPPWPHHIKARQEEQTRKARIAPASQPPKPSLAPSPRPAWLIPAIAGGGVALLLAINIGFYVAFVGGGGKTDHAERNQPVPAESAGTVSEALADATEAKPTPEAAPPATPVTTPDAAPKKPASPPRPPSPPVEEVPDRVLTTEEIARFYEPSVALIKGKKGSGTGFVARAGIVATNSHVIDGERIKDIEVRFPSAPETKQGPYPAKLLYQDKDRDLALLGVTTELPPVRVAENYKFRKGEDVTVIGNPGVGGQMILENAISRGIMSTQTKINEHSFFQLGISINPGNSGGPVFDPKGRVIGVVTLKTTKQEGLAFAVPAEDLLSALDTAESVASANPVDGSSGSRSGAPALTYAFKQGQTYAYSVEMMIDAGNVRLVLSGTSIYRVKSVDADGITFAHKGWLTATKKGKDGKTLPGGVTGPDQTKEIELKIDDKGNVVSASGSSPLPLLGDFAMLMIEPLPDDPTASWDDSQTLTLREVEQTPGAVGPRLGRPDLGNLPRGPQSRLSSRSRLNSRAGRSPAPQPPQPRPQVKVTLHEASEETKYTLGPLVGDKAPIRKIYEMATKEMVAGDPRLKMTGDGTLTFDVKAGIPLALNYKLQVVEVAGNASIKVPISVTCKLLEGKDRDAASRPPVYPPLAMNKVGNGDVSRALDGLKLPDNGRRREALRALFDAAPLDNRRAEVSRALDRVAADKDNGVRSDAIKAMGVWGDDKILANLITTLGDPKFGVRDERFEAISRLSPNEKGAEAIIPWLATEQSRAAKALRAIGPPAEGPLLRAVEEGADLKVRQEACRVLKEVGTSQSVPILERLAAMKQDADIGRRAAEAIKNITRRYPSDADWEALLKQARSADGFKRREAVERISKILPVEAHRQDVARMLESLVAEDDRGIQGMAIRALGSWGDAGSRTVLIEKLEQPDFRQHREATEALIQLGPDEACARAIASRVKTDWDFVLASLSKVGPPAEAVAISLLRGTKDVFFRNELCRILGRIGSAACLPALREACAEPFIDVPRNAIKNLESRLSGGGMGATVADLRAADGGRRMDALKRLACIKPPPGPGRDEVARALDGLWESDDVFMKGALREAVSNWGDDKSVEALVEFLSSPDPKHWEEAMGALVKLRPDARTAELLASKFSKDSRRVTEIGAKIPALVEVPLLAIVKGQGEVRWRQEACNALGQLGTPASLPALQALGGREGDDQIARDAQDALNAIKARL